MEQLQSHVWLTASSFMGKYLRISSVWLFNCSTLNFLIYEENLIFFFISASSCLGLCKMGGDYLHMFSFLDGKLLFTVLSPSQLKIWRSTSVADPDPGSGIRKRFFPDPGSRIPDLGSWIRGSATLQSTDRLYQHCLAEPPTLCLRISLGSYCYISGTSGQTQTIVPLTTIIIRVQWFQMVDWLKIFSEG